jgi:hypothetical protein
MMIRRSWVWAITSPPAAPDLEVGSNVDGGSAAHERRAA